MGFLSNRLALAKARRGRKADAALPSRHGRRFRLKVAPGGRWPVFSLWRSLFARVAGPKSVASRKEDASLVARVSNCLQTILELEPGLAHLDLGDLLMAEFQVLKTFLKRVDALTVAEDDVRRIEMATEIFLKEIRGPMTTTPVPRGMGHPVQ